MNLVDYINGLVNASLGRGAEGFTDASSPVPILSSVKTLYSSIPILLIIHLTAMIVYGLGAARLSYCYQMSTNPTATLFYVYILLAFMFSPVYYPFYGIVLNPLCLKK
jgi:hypothetical protein